MGKRKESELCYRQEKRGRKWGVPDAAGNLNLSVQNVHSRTNCNRPFPSSLLPLFQNESKCETIHMKMKLHLQVHFHANQIHFHLNGFAHRLVLKQRHKGTRKWPIETVFVITLTNKNTFGGGGRVVQKSPVDT